MNTSTIQFIKKNTLLHDALSGDLMLLSEVDQFAKDMDIDPQQNAACLAMASANFSGKTVLGMQRFIRNQFNLEG